MPKRIRIVRVPSARTFQYDVGDEPIVADHVAEAWIAEGTAEPYEPREVERAVSEADVDRYHTGGGWYELPNGEKVRGRETAVEALGG